MQPTPADDDAAHDGPPGEEMEAPVEAAEAVDPRKPAAEAARRPAFVINVYSWATPVVGALMLVIGLLAGYFGRPLINRTERAETASSSTSTGPVSTQPADGPTDVQRQEMMSYLIEQMRHFEGDEDAPVTLIEFSDFQ